MGYLIISEFKKSIENEVLSNTSQYIDSLINFLIEFKPIQSQEALTHYVTQQTLNYLDIIFQDAQNEADKRSSNGETITLDVFNDIALEKTKQYSDSISKSFNFNNENFEMLEAELELITSKLKQFIDDSKLKDELNFLAETIYKAIFLGYDDRDSVTGLVIAGYGNEEIFPSLQQIELSGVFAQRLIWNVISEIQVSQNEGCHIIPFAQSEMVDTIMNGIDPVFNRFIGQEVSNLLEENNLEDKKQNLFETISKVQQEYYIKPIYDLIAMQPIDEMAFTAKTFIELTSFKRKIVNTLETVGGPVDVLAISKGDGPIWIERKHYFNIDDNLDYRIRKGGI